MRKQYNKEQLIACIKNFEENKLNRQFISQESDSPAILLFKGGRSQRLSVLSTHLWPKQDIDRVLEGLNNCFENKNGLSDTVNFYSISIIDSTIENELKKTALEKLDINLEIFDLTRMQSIDDFNEALENESQEPDEITFIEKALFDYLATSEDSSYLKNCLYYSLILLCLYNSEGGLAYNELDKMLSEKLGKKVEKLDAVIRVLRKEGHIAPPQAGDNGITLTQIERDRIYDSIQKSKSSEIQFNESFSQIIGKYQIQDPALLLEKLRSIIIAKCQNVDNDEDETPSVEIEKYFTDMKEFTTSELQMSFFSDLGQLLHDNDYLVTLSLGEKFLELYRSDRYEQYINNKYNTIVLDTMVFIYLMCCKSSFNNKIDSMWEDLDYQRVADLCGYAEENYSKVRMTIPSDYIEETIGELRKALQLTWFTGIELPIKFSTSNIFYNFYIHICESLKVYDERCPSFEEYLHTFGFRELDSDSIYFKKEAWKAINIFLRAFNIDLINRHPHYEGFEDVKQEYQKILARKLKHKSETAINGDVRLAFYLGNKYTNENLNDEDEYYLTSWDKTLRDLRKVVNGQYSLTHSYEVRTPGDLVQTLAFKSFHINKANIGKEVFAFANDTFGFTNKVSSLFDNILNPYFASKNNSNTELVTVLLRLESTRDNAYDNFEESSRSNTKTILEDFFTMILERLTRNSCGTNDLRAFLSDPDNNDNIIDIFTHAYDTESYIDREKLAFQFIDALKTYVVLKNSENESTTENEMDL